MITAIIGLAADILALGTFALQVTTLAEGESPVHFTPIVQIITLFVLFYSWLIICWFLMRTHGKRVAQIDELSKPHGLDTALTVVFGSSVFVCPVAALWATLVFDSPGTTLIERFFLFLLVVGLIMLLLDFLVAACLGILAPLLYPNWLD